MRSYANHVPPERLCLIVEGLAGKGLRDCIEPEDVNNALQKGYVTRRYVETYYSFNAAKVLKGYAAYSEDLLSATVGDKMFVKSLGYQSSVYPIPASGSLGSNKGVSINGILNTYEGKIYSPVAPSYKADTNEYTYERFRGWKYRKYDKYKKVTFKTPPYEKSTDSAEKASESNVASASASDGELKAGLYQWHVTEATKNKQDKDKKYELRYYPDDNGNNKDDAGRPAPSAANKNKYQIVVAELSKNAADNFVTVKHENGETVQHEKVTMSSGAPSGKIGFCTNNKGEIVKPVLYLRGKLHCSGALTISTDAAEVKNTCPVVDIGQYTPKNSAGWLMHDKTEDGVLMAEGNITLLSSVKGSGAVVAKEHDVFMVGESVLNSGSDGLAVYANNVSLGSLSMATDTDPDGNALDANVDVSNVAGGEMTGDGEKILSDISYGTLWNEVLRRSWGDDGNINLDKFKNLGKLYFTSKNVRVEIMNCTKFPPDDPR
ncbi:MAG: hypothetical protein Q4F00_06955 [bacterium]|nr:hypothetical protein [bacterium]